MLWRNDGQLEEHTCRCGFGNAKSKCEALVRIEDYVRTALLLVWLFLVPTGKTSWSFRPYWKRAQKQIAGGCHQQHTGVCGRVLLFFALVPVLENPSGTSLISTFTWSGRGWCRLERSCRELSPNHSWIQVKGPTDLQIISGIGASFRVGSGPVGEGVFTMPEDRLKLGPVLMKSLKRKLLSLLKAQDMPGYRFLLNHQTFVFRGLDCNLFEPVPAFEQEHLDMDFSPLVMKFFHQNGFRSIREMDTAGFSPLHYAAVNGDPSLVQDLLALQANPNQGTRKTHPVHGFESGISPLAISCTFKNNEAVRLLISAKGRVTSSVIICKPLHCATGVNNTEAIQILLHARCPLEPNSFGVTPLESAVGAGSLEALDLLRHSIVTSLDATQALFYVAGGERSAEVVHRLVEMRADVNAQTGDWFKRTALMRAVYTFMVLQHRFHKATIFNKLMYHAKGATPLMLALLFENNECAAALIAEGAKLNLQNSHGLTAADLIRRRSGPEFLLEAFEGRVEACRRVSLLSRGWIEMHFWWKINMYMFWWSLMPKGHN